MSAPPKLTEWAPTPISYAHGVHRLNSAWRVVIDWWSCEAGISVHELSRRVKPSTEIAINLGSRYRGTSSRKLELNASFGVRSLTRASSHSRRPVPCGDILENENKKNVGLSCVRTIERKLKIMISWNNWIRTFKKIISRTIIRGLFLSRNVKYSNI